MIFTDLCPHCNQSLYFIDRINMFVCLKIPLADNFYLDDLNFSAYFPDNDCHITYPLDDNNEYIINFKIVEQTTTIFKKRYKNHYMDYLTFNFLLDTNYQNRFNLLNRLLNTLPLI